MRVVHVVTLASPDGAFGGPVRVARNQVAELARRGHDAVLAAGSRGYAGGRLPDDDAGLVRLFPVRRALPTAAFSGLTSPGLLRWLRREVPRADVVHVHLARDLVTLPAAALARRAGVPYVLQPHGMVVPTANRLAPLLDSALTRGLLQDSAAVLHLTDLERGQLADVAGGEVRLEPVGNGTPVAAQGEPLPERLQVLFCARLHPRKRPEMFARLARDLLAEGLDADFVLVGPDEGEGPAVQRLVDEVGDPSRLRWEGPCPPEQVADRVRASSLLVLPSVDEPMPMAVIEALSLGRPAVVTTSCGLAPVVRDAGCGAVVDESYASLLAAVRELLLDSDALAVRGRAAHGAARDSFSIEAVGDRLEALYDATSAHRRTA